MLLILLNTKKHFFYRLLLFLEFIVFTASDIKLCACAHMRGDEKRKDIYYYQLLLFVNNAYHFLSSFKHFFCCSLLSLSVCFCVSKNNGKENKQKVKYNINMIFNGTRGSFFCYFLNKFLLMIMAIHTKTFKLIDAHTQIHNEERKNECRKSKKIKLRLHESVYAYACIDTLAAFFLFVLYFLFF